MQADPAAARPGGRADPVRPPGRAPRRGGGRLPGDDAPQEGAGDGGAARPLRRLPGRGQEGPARPPSSSTGRPSSGSPTTTPPAARWPASTSRWRAEAFAKQQYAVADDRAARRRRSTSPTAAPPRAGRSRTTARGCAASAARTDRPLERGVALAVLVDVDEARLVRVARASRSGRCASPPTFSARR